MIWADRVAVVWAGVVFLFVALVATDSAHIEPRGYQNIMLLIVIPWLFMRGIDWICSGTLRWHQTPQRGR